MMYAGLPWRRDIHNRIPREPSGLARRRPETGGPALF
jgi:hypothetical protein